MSSLLILGGGGHARVLAETALASGSFTELAFLDDRFNQPTFPPTIYGFPVLGPLSLAFDSELVSIYPSASLGIGNTKLRITLFHRLQSHGFQLPVIVHPTAWVSPSAEIGPASVVFAQSAVQAEVSIGVAAIVNTAASLDHDVTVGDFVHICPGVNLAGGVTVGHQTLIGIGTSVIQQINIGSCVIIGAGAAVVCDISDCATAIGVPARVPSTNNASI